MSLTSHVRLMMMVSSFLFTTFIEVSAQQKNDDSIDDVFQHIPIATMFVMKAAGVDNGRNWWETIGTAATSYIVSETITYSLKHIVKNRRPDKSDHYSFPSGHATLAFSGATILHHEYGYISPWISIGGYTIATLTAVDRVRIDRHHWYDVAVGAGVGFLGTELTYHFSNKLFGKRNFKISFTGYSMDVAVCL